MSTPGCDVGMESKTPQARAMAFRGFQVLAGRGTWRCIGLCCGVADVTTQPCLVWPVIEAAHLYMPAVPSIPLASSVSLKPWATCNCIGRFIQVITRAPHVPARAEAQTMAGPRTSTQRLPVLQENPSDFLLLLPSSPPPPPTQPRHKLPGAAAVVALLCNLRAQGEGDVRN